MYDIYIKLCDIGFVFLYFCVKGESGKVEVVLKEYISLKEYLICLK